MPLRYRISVQPETVQDFILAADEKYWEGVELLSAGRRGAGIYLLGYTVEMLLKNACFRTDGAALGDRTQGRLVPIKKWAERQLPGLAPESYHSLWFWIHALRRKRSLTGREFPALFDSQLVQRVRRVYGIWWVEMRYRPDQSLDREANVVFEDVTWIRDRQIQLVN